MVPFEYYNPTKILFGEGKIAKLGKEIAKSGVKKVLLHYGKGSIFKNGVYDQVVETLNKHNIAYVELGGVKPNPVISKVEEAIKLISEENIDGIIAVGGGSVIDSAKAIAAGSKYDGNVWDFFEGKAAPESAIPLFVVLTLSATGSEGNPFGVVTKEEENKKWAFSGGVHTFPRVSVIDPTVQFSLPANQTVNGAIDAMSHIFELYLDGTPENDAIEAYAEGLLKSLMKHVKVLLEQPDNLESRSQLALCAMLALNGTTRIGRLGGDWATHTIEHSVSAFYDIPHGEGLSILFPAWMMYNLDIASPKLAKLGGALFGIDEGSDKKSAIQFIHKLREFYSEIGAPVTLSERAVSRDMLPTLAENAAIIAPIGRLKKLYKEDILNIYKLAYE